MRNTTRGIGIVGVAASMLALAGQALGSDLPPFDKVSEGYEQVVSTADGNSFFNIWKREKDGQLLAELPRGFERQKHFFAMTMGSGDIFAGLQSGDLYVYWKQYDDRLALIQPQTEVRAGGDKGVEQGIERIFTDRVLLEVPIVAKGPNGQPVIDLDQLLVNNAGTFFGGRAARLNSRLATIKTAKAFPDNVEIAIEAPDAGGQLAIYHYSISHIKGTPGYKPREADERVGYFTTSYRDFSEMDGSQMWKRYINRWNLEKADPSLSKSPPKQAIVYYIDHQVPVKYRRWVREGIEYWNKAFEEVGIVGAIEVVYQDATTGANMEKDPEDVRYNFIRWLTNGIGTAIGPSRVNPETGEILDADVVLTDGWIRAYWFQYNDLLPQVAIEGFGPETLAWLDKNPQWDPRVQMAAPEQRDYLIAQREARGPLPYGGHPAMLSRDAVEGSVSDAVAAYQVTGACNMAHLKAMNMDVARLSAEVMGLFENEAKEGADMLDGVPEWFVGPALAHLTAHEVGHTLGLRHNFKGSAVFTMAEINSEKVKDKEPFSTTVMDYNPININVDSGEIQGNYEVIGIGDYDKWAIEYGYTGGNLGEVLKKVEDPKLAYATDEDTWGPDPLARRYDLSADPLDYAENQMRLVRELRGQILDKFVKEGDSWARARRGYNITLGQHINSVSMMANWIGGTFQSRAKKGDPGDLEPLTPVPADQQRAALNFVVNNTFYDDAYGLTPELLSKMTVDKWYDGGGMGSMFEEPAFPLHDRIRGIQASAMTMILNPTTLDRVYNNEVHVSADEDFITLAEVMRTVKDAAWSELKEEASGQYTDRKPMISSLRRGLQGQHIDRLISLSNRGFPGASGAALSNVANLQLRELRQEIKASLKNSDAMDTYTKAHLMDASDRIARALEAQYTRTR
ncbi:MAG: zinc-dependent metalloprotease [Phycisphaerales bacterium JB060]